MIIAQTNRLKLRHIDTKDAPFILGLLNDPAFLQYVGDKEVRDLGSAKTYILEGPVASYKTLGYGLYLIELNKSGKSIGICGLLKRDFLDHAEIGFALMPEYCGYGYAFESAQATVELARDKLRLAQIVAITASDNARSIKLLEKLGMSFDKHIELPVSNKKVNLYSVNL
jgi:RimJ/RimL family protein N-acetyltransferase